MTAALVTYRCPTCGHAVTVTSTAVVGTCSHWGRRPTLKPSVMVAERRMHAS